MLNGLLHENYFRSKYFNIQQNINIDFSINLSFILYNIIYYVPREYRYNYTYIYI